MQILATLDREMRLIIATLVLGLLLAAAPLEAQRSSDALSGSDVVTRRIQGEYDSIQQGIPGYSSVQRDFTSAEGYGVLTAFLNGGALVKLVVQLARSSEGRVTEFYYWDDDLIFVLDASEPFPPVGGAAGESGAAGATPDGARTPAGPSTGRAPNVTESRFWFDQRKLVRWLESSIGPEMTESSVASSQSRFTAKADELLRLSDLWKAFARSDATDFSRFSGAASGGIGAVAAPATPPSAAPNNQ